MGYGYKSFDSFVEAAKAINAGKNKASDFDNFLPTGQNTLLMTAILEAARISLDKGGKMIGFEYEG